MSPHPPPPGWPGDLWDAELSVDKSSPTPAYLQLKTQLERAIHHGRLTPGAAIPSERSLAVTLGLSRMTVRRAFQALVEAGLVEQRRGSGTFVRGQTLEQPIDAQLRSYSDEVRLAGFEPGAELIAAERVAAGEAVARALEAEPGATVLRLLVLRTADGEPLELQDIYLPPRFLELSLVDLMETTSVYRTLDAQFGARPARSRQAVGARLATQSEARYLKLARDVPVLTKERVTYGLDERPLEYALGVARSDRYRLVFQVSD